MENTRKPLEKIDELSKEYTEVESSWKVMHVGLSKVEYGSGKHGIIQEMIKRAEKIMDAILKEQRNLAASIQRSTTNQAA